jgi:hypothetical protein
MPRFIGFKLPQNFKECKANHNTIILFLFVFKLQNSVIELMRKCSNIFSFHNFFWGFFFKKKRCMRTKKNPLPMLGGDFFVRHLQAAF